jgi:glycosyltransferase involved in cell wall biosynthesis
VGALRSAGTRVALRGWASPFIGLEPALLPFSRDDLPGEEAPAGAPTVAHLVPEHYPHVRQVVGDGPLVAHTVWETDRLPQHWPALLDATDLVVVPTAWNRDVFAASGVQAPVAVVPHVACDPVEVEAARAHPGGALDIPDGVVVFYCIGRWDQRKLLSHTVTAYLEAFTGDDPVRLVVKTGPDIQMPPEGAWSDRPLAWSTAGQVALLVSRHRNPAAVQLEVATWTDEQIAALHTRGDVYVTLTRGEGWGLGAVDAATYGNPVVATGWGAFPEVLHADATWFVGHELVPAIHTAVASYSPDQRWAEPDVAHAVELLRQVAADLPAARRRAAPQRDRLLLDLAPAAVAARFRQAMGSL